MYTPMERAEYPVIFTSAKLTYLRLSVEGLIARVVYGVHQGLDRPLPVALQPLHSCCTPSIPRVFSTCSQQTSPLPDMPPAAAETHSINFIGQLAPSRDVSCTSGGEVAYVAAAHWLADLTASRSAGAPEAGLQRWPAADLPAHVRTRPPRPSSDPLQSQACCVRRVPKTIYIYIF